MADDELDDRDLLLRDPPDDGERDALEGLGPLPRVAKVHTVMTPMHREPPPEAPAKPPVKPAVELRCVPFVPAPPKAQMRTMSDLGTSGPGTGIARAGTVKK